MRLPRLLQRSVLRASLLAALASIVLALGVACGDNDADDEPTPAPSPTTTSTSPSAVATPQRTATPPGSTTPIQPTPELTPRPSGNALIDAVITSVEQQDAPALEGLIHYFLAACTMEGIGAIPCPAGQSPGATVAVFGSAACEGAFTLRDDPDVARIVEEFLATDRELWAVVQTPPFPEDERIPGKYMVIFRTSAGGGSAVSVDEEGVTYLHFGCGTVTPPEFFTRGSNQWLIEPQ